MVQLGLQIIPQMSPDEAIETIQAAESLGYQYCLLADEGFMPDVYATLGAAAKQTDSIMLGPITNGYTRHPAVTALAVATLNELSGGRALISLVAGGSMVLNPMGIPRDNPLTVVRETMTILRKLWSGEEISWQGKKFQLNHAQIWMGKQEIPIWLAGRGPKMLRLAGETADGAYMMVKADLSSAIKIVEQGGAGKDSRPLRIYVDRIAYTPDLLDEAAELYSYVVMDTPARQLRELGITEEMVDDIRQAMAAGGPAEAVKLVTLDMIQNYQIAGTWEECAHAIHDLIADNDLDVFLLSVVSKGLEANIRMMKDIRKIVLE